MKPGMDVIIRIRVFYKKKRMDVIIRIRDGLIIRRREYKKKKIQNTTFIHERVQLGPGGIDGSGMSCEASAG